MAITVASILDTGIKQGKTKEEIQSAVAKFREFKRTGKQPQAESETKEGLFSAIGRDITAIKNEPIEAAKGFGKTALQHAQTLSSLGQKGASFLTGVKSPVGESVISKDLRTTEGEAQEAGGRVEEVAEYFASLPSKGASFVAKLALQAAETVGISAMQSGKLGKEELTAGGLVASTGLLGKAVSKLVSKTPLTKIKQAIAPRLTKGNVLKDIDKNYDIANNAILEGGIKPKDSKSYYDAIITTKNSIWDKVESFITRGEEAGATVDLTSISKKIKELANNPSLKRVNKSSAKQLDNFADDFIGAVKEGGEIVSTSPIVGVREAEKIKEELNKGLKGLYGELSTSNTMKDAQKMVTREIGVLLDDVLSKLPNEFKNVKDKYSALRSIEDDVLKRYVKSSSVKPDSLVSGMSKVGAAAGLATSAVTGNPVAALSAATALATSAAVKKTNSSDYLIKTGFKELAKSKIPRSGLSNFLLKAKQGSKKVTARELAQLLNKEEGR